MTAHSPTQTLDRVESPLARLEGGPVTRDRPPDTSRPSTPIVQTVRDPLEAIKASVRLLQTGDLPAAEVRARASDIGRQVARLDRVVDDLLDFARPSHVEPAPVEVASLVWDAAGAILDGWEGPHLRVALEAGIGTIVTDRERLQGVLARLLENAREAVRLAGRTGAVDGVEIGGRRLASCRLLLWVEDRGAGLAAADLPHVFEPFSTATRRTGTGLELAIARKVVKALGGAIRVESREGEGMRVEVELPDDAFRESAEHRGRPRRWGSQEGQEERR